MKVSILIFTLVLAINLVAQEKDFDKSTSIDQSSPKFNFVENSTFYAGISAGSESVFGLPKLSFQTKIFELNDFQSFVGLEASAYILFALWYNVNLQTGIQYKNLFIESSIGFFEIPPAPPIKLSSTNHNTFTPKIGFQYKAFRFKIGHSIIFGENYDLNDTLYLDFGAVNLNFDLLIAFPLEKLLFDLKSAAY